MEDYIRRILDDTLDGYQPRLSAIELCGAKGVGKTVTASQRVVSTLRLDTVPDAQRLRADPTILEDLPGPVLVDEWSRVPESWDMIRRAVDDGAPAGRFILTGSATVPKGVHVHSGAGRIVRFQMRPMSLAERGIEQPTVSLAQLVAGNVACQGHTSIRLRDYVREIIGSGLPGIRFQDSDLIALLLDSYLDDIVTREFSEQGHTVRKPAVLKSWMAAYAAATGTSTSYRRILEASTPGESGKPSKGATLAYRDTLRSLWMLDPLDAWLPTSNRLKRLAQAPKHYLADPALACRLLHVGVDRLMTGADQHSDLREGTLLGALFEHLAVLSVRVYAQRIGATVCHMRTQGGDHEVDMIIEAEGDGIFGIEVKLSQGIDDFDCRHLLWLREMIGDDFIGGAVLNTGGYAYKRQDGLAVVPLALLAA